MNKRETLRSRLRVTCKIEFETEVIIVSCFILLLSCHEHLEYVFKKNNNNDMITIGFIFTVKRFTICNIEY